MKAGGYPLQQAIILFKGINPFYLFFIQIYFHSKIVADKIYEIINVVESDSPCCIGIIWISPV